MWRQEMTGSVPGLTASPGWDVCPGIGTELARAIAFYKSATWALTAASNQEKLHY